MVDIHEMSGDDSMTPIRREKRADASQNRPSDLQPRRAGNQPPMLSEIDEARILAFLNSAAALARAASDTLHT
jgi:hypothetical protein